MQEKYIPALQAVLNTILVIACLHFGIQISQQLVALLGYDHYPAILLSTFTGFIVLTVGIIALKQLLNAYKKV
ncbi:hypothetical protein H0X48_01350 [Candidatus Dependentiae bacterium]|nr:hypothetical protein [Candidatus Dependentiae bacterium]